VRPERPENAGGGADHLEGARPGGLRLTTLNILVATLCLEFVLVS